MQGGVGGRNPAVAPPGRSSTSSSASPSSSSSAVSAPPAHLGFDSIQHQQQQLGFRQSLQQQQQQQQQQLRKPEGDNAFLAYQGGGMHGVMAAGNFPSSSSAVPLSQPSRKFNDLPHQQVPPQLREENQNKGQGLEQHGQNPIHQPYIQFALQAAQHKPHGNLLAQQGKIGMGGPPVREQDLRQNSMKIQELMALQAANQAQMSLFKKSVENSGQGENKMEQGSTSIDQRNEIKPPQIAALGQSLSSNMIRPVQQSQVNIQNIANNQLMQQLRLMHNWAQEHNIDLSVPGNMNVVAQMMPAWHAARLQAMQKSSEASAPASQSGLPPSKPQFIPSPVNVENSAHGNSLNDLSAQMGPVKSPKLIPSGSPSSSGATPAGNFNNLQMQQQQQLAGRSRENQNERAARPPIATGNGGPTMHMPQSSGSMTQGADLSQSKNIITGPSPGPGPETLQMQYFRSLQQNRAMSQAAIPSSEVPGNSAPAHTGSSQIPPQRAGIGFTKQQLHVLKAQILAFRRLKRGERNLPQEVLQAIVPPPIDLQPQQMFVTPGMVNQERPLASAAEEHTRHVETTEKVPVGTSSSKSHSSPKEEPLSVEEKAVMVTHMQGVAGSRKEPMQIGSVGKVEQTGATLAKSEQEAERGNLKLPSKVDYNPEKGKSVPAQAPGVPVVSTNVDAGQTRKPASTGSAPVPKDIGTRKYHGPLFDFPFFTRRHDSLGAMVANNSSNLILAYDMKDLLFEEGMDVLNKKRTENLRKISGLLAVNLERKRIRPDLVLRLQIEERKLRLLDFQARLRDEVDQQQQEIMAMPDRPYRKFVRQCERQRIELARQVQQLQKATREKQLKSIFQWRKKLLEAHWAIRDARTARNRGVAKYHERMLREFSKRKDEDRTKRMEALKNNDVDRYREMLLEQQTNIPGDAAQRYSVLSSFLSQTEEYLHKLGGKITAAKNHQEVEEAANAAAAAARSQGLSEEEIKAAAACAGEEVMIRNRFSEMNAPKESSSVNKYYNLAHAVNERVIRQPSMLRAGTLRDYQIVGLQWMLSLYNNKLNGILADEMGLGKTVQVMAVIAYLMEFKGNYGPHLIIVPNAVLVNWKSELLNWLPSVSCIFYVGSKDQRSKLFSHEVSAVKFNVLVTTYEFIMYDRSKLSKIDWKYIIIDEAQRMKDRESVLARDLDRYRCQRRLLLTGTPLQNDLKELWSLLNLLLPEVFDNRKAFHDWFSKPFQKDGPSHNPEEDDWLETEKKVIIIHRLHQILEPFMLRRRVEDVEGSLPRKVSTVLRCRMSAMQSCIYDWIKSTGTIRVDPEDEMRRVQKNPMYQVKIYKNLNNKCMELRKVCNHPLLNYPYFNEYSKDFIIRSCGKLWILDRILIKLQRAGHRVLLFSTMTKLLDILEEYLQWRRLVYRRIDGTTSLEDRESAIVDFNSPNSDCFIFLLSIRAAGRGLNLQTADTVVIYDPDPNPQNEEQAVARAHRIGQQREVKVIYMEAVVDKIPSYQKEDDLRNGGTGDIEEDDLAGKDRYMGSIESLIRNNIQQYKIDMADEVINAGRFDQRTTHEERRLTLETLLHDDERYQETVHDVPSLQEVNRMIARSEEEIELFDQMDEEFDWTGEMMKYNQVPKWLRAGSREVNGTIANLSKKPSKNLLASNINLDTDELFSGLSPSRTERRRGRTRAPQTGKYSIYRELEDEDGENSDASSEERNAYSLHEEEGEIGEFEDEEFNGAVDAMPGNKDQSEEEGPICDGGSFELPRAIERNRSSHLFEEAGSSGSSSGNRRTHQPSTPLSSQKFGSLSALDARPGPLSRSMPDDLEEGEIAASGDSHMDLQQSGSWNHERDDNEEEQVLQPPTIKRKRSVRIRPRYNVEKLEEKSTNERVLPPRASMRGSLDYDTQFRAEPEIEPSSEPVSDRRDTRTSSLKQKRNLPSKKSSNAMMPQHASRLGYLSGSTEDANEPNRGSWNGRTMNTGLSFAGAKMSDSMQRKYKNVISKLQRRIDKDGHQVAPVLSDWWKRNSSSITDDLLDLQKIDQRVDGLEYDGVPDFIADVQLMLKNVVQCCGYSHEARYEARKLNDVFLDIMKIAFPGTDYREARNSFMSSVPGGPATIVPSPKQSKHPNSFGEVEPNSVSARSTNCGLAPPDEDGRTRGHASKLRESGGGSASGSAHNPLLLAHPGELVICKKKRKDRDKTMAKQRMGQVSPSNPARAGPLSPSVPGRAVAPASPMSRGGLRVPPLHNKDTHPSQQSIHPSGWGHQQASQQQQQQVSGGSAGGSPNVAEVQWAKPAKKLRTDTGKRRPSHL
ncbi:ATP-dependent helicase BRM [Dioscorea cayenensis subsp. rotundata]|uniref:ATP-dependent helicase BRM n=1 Tax=Dioscorea cayennensis subsp. rotundata TaxID=55577 RepID=A0AB40B5A0_DIOCR|nr:ATP-dependent helicase BRM [Dioscorea cayenensis subsp. rotundata]